MGYFRISKSILQPNITNDIHQIKPFQEVSLLFVRNLVRKASQGARFDQIYQFLRKTNTAFLLCYPLARCGLSILTKKAHNTFFILSFLISYLISCKSVKHTVQYANEKKKKKKFICLFLHFTVFIV